MPFDERAEILRGFKGVVDVVQGQDDDDSVCPNLIELRPDIFANGGDRKSNNTPEVKVCELLGIEMQWNVGGEMSAKAHDTRENERRCGRAGKARIQLAGHVNNDFHGMLKLEHACCVVESNNVVEFFKEFLRIQQ